MSAELPVLKPQWPAPSQVRALVTTRAGGCSSGSYAELNLGDHVGDVAQTVAANRARLSRLLPAEPIWLSQVHGNRVVEADAAAPGAEADGAWSGRPGTVCAVLTADCLPVLFCDDAGSRVAAAHAGWRGLAGGVLEAAVQALAVPPERLLAWLGPAIGPRRFEVGDEVRARFVDQDPALAEAFRPSPAGRWLADLYGLARGRLKRVGVERIYGGGWCTYDDARFYSYRRDGRTGRFASLVWLT